jgi:hypothetical protein
MNAIYPGYITSKTDGQSHYIDYFTLIRLYNLNPCECFNASRREDLIGRDITKITKYYPDFHGRYAKPS